MDNPGASTHEVVLRASISAIGHRLPPSNIASSSALRRKKEDQIAQENLAIFKRLQNVKPSKDVSRQVLTKEFQTNRTRTLELMLDLGY
eukprot:gene22024-29082_t